MFASCKKLVWVVAWIGLTCMGTPASTLKTVLVGPGTEQLFADAVADFGSTGEDTVILLAQGKTVSLINVTIRSAQPAPGYRPFSSGTVTIRPGPGNSSAPTILDTGMRYHIASYKGLQAKFSQTARLLVYDITFINNCDYAIKLDEKNPLLMIDTGMAPSFMISDTTYQAFQFYRCTFYIRQADLTTWVAIFYVLRSPFPQIKSRLPSADYQINIQADSIVLSAYSGFIGVASLPGVLFYNLTAKAISNPSDPLLQSLWAAGKILPPISCGLTQRPLPPMVWSGTPTWLTTDTEGFWAALNQATSNFYFGTALGLPTTVVMTGIAIPAACSHPLPVAPVSNNLVLSGPSLSGRYYTEGVLDLRDITSPILPVAVGGQVFMQYLRLRNLPTQPLPTSDTPSVFPLSSFPLSNNNTNSPSSFIQMHNVTLELPDLDYLALLALAQPDLITQVNTTVQAHATALNASITTLAVSSVLPGLAGMEVTAFTGWSLNITNLYVLPAQERAPASLALSLAASSQAAPPAAAAAQSGDLSKQYTGAQLGGAVAGTALGSLLLGAVLAWLLMAAGCIRKEAAAGKDRLTSESTDATAQGLSMGGSTVTCPVFPVFSRPTSPSPLGLQQDPIITQPHPAYSSLPKAASPGPLGSPHEDLIEAAEAGDAPSSLLEVVSRLQQSRLSQQSQNGAYAGHSKLHSSDVRALEAFCSDHTSMQVSKVVAPTATPDDDPALEQITLMLSAGTRSSLSPGLAQGHNTMTQSAQPTPPQQPTSGAVSAASVTILVANEAGNATVPDMPVTQSSGHDSPRASTASQVVTGRSTDVSSKGSGTSDAAFRTAVGQLVEELQGDMNKVAVDGILGQGSSGIVYSGRWRGLDVALKTMVLEIPDAQAGLARKQGQAALEVAVASSVDHPNVVRTYYYDIQAVRTGPGAAQHGLQIDETRTQEGTTPAYKIFLIQERCATSLSAFLGLHNLRKMEAAVKTPLGLMLLLDIAQGLEYLHGRNIVHGDLKPANVLLAPAGGGIGVTAKLADFGLSARLAVGATHVSNYSSGTPFYVAPEVVEQHRASPASDMFAFGVILWQLHTEQNPFVPTAQGTFAWNPLFPHFAQDHLPTQAYAAVTVKCLQRDPKERPTAAGLVRFLKGIIDQATQQAGNGHTTAR